MHASCYLWIYTFLGSVFMLLSIFTFYDKAGSTNYQILGCFKIDNLPILSFSRGFF